MAESTTSQTTQIAHISPIADPQSPFYLHHSDSPGSVTVNPKLNSSNYVAWSRSFLLAMSIRNKVDFLNGTIPKPQITDPLFLPWTRCNNLLVAWLLDSITEPIVSTIFFMDTASEIWTTLKQNFAQPDDTRVCNLQYTLGNVSQGSRTVDSYFIELKGIWEELRSYRPLPHCKCGNCNPDCFKAYSDQYQKDMVFRFLNGLNESFSADKSKAFVNSKVSERNGKSDSFSKQIVKGCCSMRETQRINSVKDIPFIP